MRRAGFDRIEIRPDLAGIDARRRWSGWTLSSIDARRLARRLRARAGGVALFPADGLYGLACDPTRADAIERIHPLKGRDDGKPSAVMYFSPLAMRELVAAMGRAPARRWARCCPGR